MARNRKRAQEREARHPQPVPSARSAQDEDTAPEPLAHAAPDAELVEAQLALGRPELTPGGDLSDEAYAEEDAGEISSAGAAVAIGVGAPPAHGGNRLVNFIQGSWRELQRVQWPDRRQVIQATGVVLGFVIVAGVFLGVADFLAGHVMNYVLQGHW